MSPFILAPVFSNPAISPVRGPFGDAIVAAIATTAIPEGSSPMSIDPVTHARRWKTLAVLSLSLVIIGLDNTILNIALPSLQEEFSASRTQLQWMVDAYLLAFAGLLLVFGTLSDRLGRKLGLQIGISIFGLASLVAP